MWNKYLKNKLNRSGRQKAAVFAIGLLTVLIPVLLIINKNSQKVEAAWSPAHNQWAKRQRLSITNNSAENLASGTTVGVTINTQSLSEAGKLQSNCNDIRIVYQPDENTFEELPHHLVLPNNSLCYTSTATLINFVLQSALNSAAESTDYYLYFAKLYII